MKRILHITMLLVLMAPIVSLYAKSVDPGRDVDCSKTTLQSEIDKLDNSIANTLYISGHCTEDVVITEFINLTLIGTGGASLTATSFIPEDPGNSTIALLVNHSRVTVKTLTINAGDWAASCLRSTCDFHDTIIQGGHNGLHYQDHSKGAIIGSTAIQNSFGWGLGVFGASSINIRRVDTFPYPAGPGPVISGHSLPYYNPEDPSELLYDSGIGAVVLDGSFLRTDSATFSGNGTGIYAHRNATIKIYGEDGGVVDNVHEGVFVGHASTAGIGLPVTGNGGAGIYVGPLSSFNDQGSTFSDNLGGDVFCDHSTAISQPQHWCGN